MSHHVPSPYSEAEGGARWEESREERDARPPLLPRWKVRYSAGENHGELTLRAANIDELHAELQRLYGKPVKYMSWQIDEDGERVVRDEYGDTAASLCHGHPGAPLPSA